MMDLSDRRVAAAVARLVRGLVDVALRDRMETRLYGTVFGPPDTVNRKVAVQIRGQAEPSAGFSYGQVVPRRGDYVRVVIDPKGDRYVDEVQTAPAGTSMPSDPLNGDRVWRSDLGMEFYWDGTRWLSSQVFVQHLASTEPLITANAFIGFTPPPIELGGGISEIYMLELLTSAYVGAPNSVAHHWNYCFSATSGDIVCVSDATSSADVWIRRRVPIGTVLAVDETVWAFWAGKSGSPGALQIGAAVTYRLVGT